MPQMTDHDALHPLIRARLVQKCNELVAILP
jgi:hypothetical protein